MNDDPQYVSNIDETGDVSFRPQKFAKWQTPTGMIQATMLHSVGRKRYKNRDEQAACNEIGKQALKLSDGVESPYPWEWIMDRCELVRKLRRGEIKSKTDKPPQIGLKGLVSMIKNEDKKTEWLDKNRNKLKKEETWDDLAAN